MEFLRNWTLPTAMVCGALAYFALDSMPLAAGSRRAILRFTEVLQPTLLFCMLFIAFCKVKPSDLRPRMWHLWLLLLQVGVFAGGCFILWRFPEAPMRVLIESFTLVVICPTATACSVVTQKLWGDAAATISYTILINAVISIVLPLMLPLAHPQGADTFLSEFAAILGRVFPMLIAPLLLAWTVRYLLPGVHKMLLQARDLAFYMWAVGLAVAIAVTCRALMCSRESLLNVALIALVTLLACILQFACGKKIGSLWGVRIEGGQALGQKNTVFAIWLAYNFLSPVAATAGGFYTIWHNIVNSWQLYRQRHKNL